MSVCAADIPTAVYCPEAPVHPDTPPHLDSMVLPLTDEGAHAGNLWVRDTLTKLGLPADTVYAAVNIAAEFSQNACRWGSTGADDSVMTFTIAIWDGRLKLTVSDPGRMYAPVEDPGPAGSGEHESGYGLQLVEALSEGRWGTEAIFGGKAAWAELIIDGGVR